MLVHDDGSGSSSIPGQWLGETESTAVANVNAQLQTVPASILFGVPAAGNLVLSSYNALHRQQPGQQQLHRPIAQLRRLLQGAACGPPPFF